MRPHRRQPTRLRHPWDSLGKITGVGCHFLLLCVQKSPHIYTCAMCMYASSLVCVCTHIHTCTHTHLSFQASKAFCTAPQPFSQPSGLWDLLLLHLQVGSRVRKMNSWPFQRKNSIIPVVIQGDLTSSFAYVLVFFFCFCFFCFFCFFFWQVNSSSLLGLYPSTCLPLSDFLGQKHVFAAGPHPSAICKIQDPSLITVWNWNQKVLEWIHAQ